MITHDYLQVLIPHSFRKHRSCRQLIAWPS